MRLKKHDVRLAKLLLVRNRQVMKIDRGEKETLVAVIVDDEQPSAEALSKLLSLYCPHVQVISKVKEISECLKVLSDNTVDIVFLDIALGGESGFDLFHRVPFVDFQVVFTTSYSEFAIKALRADAVDYLLKPIDPIELRTAVNKAISRMDELSADSQVEQSQLTGTEAIETNGIAVVTSTGINLIHLEDVIHIEGSGSYSTFYFVDTPPMIASRNLMHYERLIASERFYRTHQSHLINLSHLRSFNAHEAQAFLTGNRIVPVAKSKKAGLLDKIRDMYRGA